MNAHTSQNANAETIRRAGDILWLPLFLSIWFIQPELAGTGLEMAGLVIHGIAACVVAASGLIHLRELLA